MLREFLDYASDINLVRDLRDVVENDQSLVICGPDRPTNLEFLDLVCRNRLPFANRLGFLLPGDRAHFGATPLVDLGLVEAQAGKIGTQEFLRSALRQDPDGLILTDLADEDVLIFVKALMTGHSRGTAAIVPHATVAETLEAWIVTLARGVNGTREQTDHLLNFALKELKFVELRNAPDVTPVASIAQASVSSGRATIDVLASRSEIAAQGRDSTLDGLTPRYQYRKDLRTGAARAATESRDPFSGLATRESLRNWPSAPGTKAYVPICSALPFEKRRDLLDFIQTEKSWPRLMPDGPPRFLLVQVEGSRLPVEARSFVAEDRVFRLFYTPPEDSELSSDDYFDVFTKAFQIDIGPDDWPAHLPKNVLRENFEMKELVAIDDHPHGAEGGDTETCYGGNKFLGWPWWVQGARWPSCRNCGQRMTFFLQIDGWEGEFAYLLGDFKFQIFGCAAHPGEWGVVQDCT